MEGIFKENGCGGGKLHERDNGSVVCIQL